MTPAVSFRGVTRHFGAVRAVDGVDLDIAEGEFFAMLGPSGSGKTTCLRIVAGFERPDAGRVSLFGQDVTAVPPYRRSVNTVFQDYALFPHLNVVDNVAYGLMIAGLGKRERRAKAEDALAMVALPDLGGRRPAQLSGGQRQRVALARALVNRPRVLLLDEPLGALDLKLREAMQDELKALQRRVGITFVFVTHDQGEALSMADRVAVFNEGRIVQVGTPAEVYGRPATRFVADFVGSSNVLDPRATLAMGGPAAWASLRPEAVRIASPEAAVIWGRVVGTRYLGSATRVMVRLEALPAGEATREGLTELAVLVPGGQPVPEAGSRVGLRWEPAALHLMAAP